MEPEGYRQNIQGVWWVMQVLWRWFVAAAAATSLCGVLLGVGSAAVALPGPAPTWWQQCRGYGTDSIVALAVALYPIRDLGGLGCREAAYQAGFVGFNRWYTGSGMNRPPYYSPPQRCRIIARHRWHGVRAHLWQCSNSYAHGPTSFRVDVIRSSV